MCNNTESILIFYLLLFEKWTKFFFSCRVSYLEIYNESMCDLLATIPDGEGSPVISPMTVVEYEDGIHIKGLSTMVAQNEEEALNFLFEVFWLVL